MLKEVEYTINVLENQNLTKMRISIQEAKSSEKIIEETPLGLEKEIVKKIIKFLHLEGDVAYIKGSSYPFLFEDSEWVLDFLYNNNWDTN